MSVDLLEATAKAKPVYVPLHLKLTAMEAEVIFEKTAQILTAHFGRGASAIAEKKGEWSVALKGNVIKTPLSNILVVRTAHIKLLSATLDSVGGLWAFMQGFLLEITENAADFDRKDVDRFFLNDLCDRWAIALLFFGRCLIIKHDDKGEDKEHDITPRDASFVDTMRPHLTTEFSQLYHFSTTCKVSWVEAFTKSHWQAARGAEEELRRGSTMTAASRIFGGMELGPLVKTAIKPTEDGPRPNKRGTRTHHGRLPKLAEDDVFGPGGVEEGSGKGYFAPKESTEEGCEVHKVKLSEDVALGDKLVASDGKRSRTETADAALELMRTDASPNKRRSDVEGTGGPVVDLEKASDVPDGPDQETQLIGKLQTEIRAQQKDLQQKDKLIQDLLAIIQEQEVSLREKDLTVEYLLALSFGVPADHGHQPGPSTHASTLVASDSDARSSAASSVPPVTRMLMSPEIKRCLASTSFGGSLDWTNLEEGAGMTLAQMLELSGGEGAETAAKEGEVHNGFDTVGSGGETVDEVVDNAGDKVTGEAVVGGEGDAGLEDIGGDGTARDGDLLV